MIEGLKRKSRKAFHTLYRDYYAAMVVYALKFLKVKEEAEDAVQDVFLSLWEAEKPFDSIDNLRSFLYTSVKNRCLNILRERSVRRKYEEHIIDFYKEMENEEPIEQTYAEVLGEVYRLIDEPCSTWTGARTRKSPKPWISPSIPSKPRKPKPFLF